MKHTQNSFIGVIFFLCTSLLFSNDSTGFVSTGGVKYFKNKNISMVSEDLYISIDKIRVDYEFRNNTNRDITETILFPLPLFDGNDYMDWADVDGLHKSFKVWADDKPVKYTKHIIHKKKTPNNEVSIDDQVVYSWKQTFPANQILKVRHEYKPLVGGSVTLGFSDKESRQEMIRDYCMDKTFLHTLKTKSKQGDASYSALGYILTTGANWAKPIERFRLTIDKPKDSLISFCWDSPLKRVSATRFEASKTNFTPKRDLDIIFVYP